MAASVISGQAASGVTPSVAGVPAPAAPAMAVLNNASLYVGDLESNVNEAHLYDLFSSVGQISSVRVCRDQNQRYSLGYGYVNYNTQREANNAMEMLNFTLINGKPIRIMFSNRDPTMRKSGYANVFIKNLDTNIDNKALHDTFAVFGNVLSCKVAFDGNGQSKGYGFVQFDREEAAQEAIKRLNGMLLNDKKVYVGLFMRRQERIRINGSPKFTNIYIKNLSAAVTDEDLKKLFASFGTITSAVVMRDANGESRGFGFVNFESADAAAAAVEQMDGETVDDKVLYVGRAQRKAEREAELRAKFEQERKSRYEKLIGANLYLKNLDETMTDEKLKELFSEFGTITSSKVMLDEQGLSKGSGFVAFSSPEEATKALHEMNGKMLGRKPLYVAVAQQKEERKARLQAHFAQIRAPGAITPLASGIPGFHHVGPRIPQQLYFGQGSPCIIPTQPAGFGFQQQLLPGIRPGVAPNFIMPPLQRQGQPWQRMGGRRGGNFQQLLHRNSNQGGRYTSNGRNGVDSSAVPQGLAMMQLPFDGSVPVSPLDVPRTGPVPMPALASALASASPENQRLMLGEQLFPLVNRLELDYAAKVTGMLLEMDQTEVLHLIESPDALKDKVAEAMEVLHKASSNPDVNDQLGALTIA